MYSQFTGEFAVLLLATYKRYLQIRRGNVISTKVAQLAMVQHFPRNVMQQTLHNGSTQNQFVASTETRGTAYDLVKTHSSNRKGIRKVLLSQGFDPDTSDILITSWMQGTTSNYSQYINK